jgi:hypothetical protein
MSSAALTQAEQLQADWLYMSGNGTWLERNVTLTDAESTLALPIDNLMPELFWWQSEESDTRVAWQSPNAQGWPNSGDKVTSEGLVGEWLNEQVQSQHLVLSQDQKRRYWPIAQMHLLEWSKNEAADGFELTITQPDNTESQFQYAWLDSFISAKVAYRLSLTDEPVLFQELIISNNSQYDLVANGYSFALTNSPSMPVQRAMSSMVQSEMVVPQSSQSEGIPTLVGNSKVALSAQANLWLPVSNTPLTQVERQYSLTWDTRMQGLQQANSAIEITAESALPDIPGILTIGVFDQQLATLTSQYSPSSEHHAVINLGQSSLLTMTSNVIGENQWSLLVSNRSDEHADLNLMISHWNGKQNEQIPMTIQVNANDSKKVSINLGQGGKVVIGK